MVLSPPNSCITVTTTAEVDLREHWGATATMGRRLALVIHCGGKGEVAPLKRDAPLVVGRGFPSQVHVEDKSISRQHARFMVRDDSVTVEDLGSRNGTFVNGQKIDKALLSPGDEVRMGAALVTLAARRADGAPPRTPGPILEDERVQAAYALARRAAQTEMPVLILGETGTGKEHLARTVHAASTRLHGPFKAVNCGAIAESLVESQLFGHERGAFTGADRQTKGIFEQATGGVVFLDEVAELPLSAQAALLRVLETKTLCRVGGSREVAVDVRIVAATHCDLAKMVEDKTFRRDLFFRLNTVTLELPPLRERPGELEPLVELFLGEARQEWGLEVSSVDAAALELLRAYDWPGNIRQLRHAVEHAALAAGASLIRKEHLPGLILDARGARENTRELPDANTEEEPGLSDQLLAYEAQLVAVALRRAGGNRAAAAKILRVPLRTLYRRLKELKLTREGS